MPGDVFDHLAAIELPMPELDEVPPDVLEEAREDTYRARYERAKEEREWWDATSHGPGDPVLDAIAQTRRELLRTEHHLRLLLAYGKEFVRPRGYTLAQLAEHAGMSISGVRTAYDLDDEGRIVAERTGLAPRRGFPDAGE